MATSEARIRANRINASKSTGPKSELGKDRSKRNALQHGLTARVLRTDEEVEALGEAAEKPPGEFTQQGPLGLDWIAGEIQLLKYRIARSEAIEDRLRERVALRASICWDDDKRLEAETIGSAIRKRPADVARKLEEIPQGCLWMIERWAMLARAFDRDGHWDEAMKGLAFDLLGTPLELRKGVIGEGLDFQGRVIDPGTDLAGLARSEVARLVAIKDGLAEVDAFDRSSAEAGVATDLGAEGIRLQKYERELQRRLRWYHNLFEELTSPGPEVEPEEVSPGAEGEPAEGEPSKPQGSSMPSPEPTRRERRAQVAQRRKAAAERKLARRVE